MVNGVLVVTVAILGRKGKNHGQNALLCMRGRSALCMVCLLKRLTGVEIFFFLLPILGSEEGFYFFGDGSSVGFP